MMYLAIEAMVLIPATAAVFTYPAERPDGIDGESFKYCSAPLL
jgi:hypothetical protein